MGGHAGHHMPMTTASPGHDMAAMSAGSMDHAGGHGNSMDHMMKMWFHFDLGDTVLFKDWVLSTCWSTFVACAVFFVLALFYEGLKCYREHLIKRWIYTCRAQISIIGHGDSSPSHQGNGDSLATTTRPANRAWLGKMFSKPHFTQSVLHVLQVAISYTLMLGFMTFNGWLCIAILSGAGCGYFMFCWRKLTIVDVTEHCH